MSQHPEHVTDLDASTSPLRRLKRGSSCRRTRPMPRRHLDEPLGLAANAQLAIVVCIAAVQHFAGAVQMGDDECSMLGCARNERPREPNARTHRGNLAP